jgi:hypothetical protein
MVARPVTPSRPEKSVNDDEVLVNDEMLSNGVDRLDMELMVAPGRRASWRGRWSVYIDLTCWE